MTSRRIAMLLLASAFGLPSAPLSAQAAAEPAARHGATPRKVVHAKRPPKTGGRASAAPAVRAPILGDDGASSLERRRKAFFATTPDEGGPEQPASPSSGVTLGGSGGISPGMGFAF